MAHLGFIRDKLDVKFLILYLMARVAAPIDLATLTDLALCDEGVDYFLLTQSAAELVETGHLTLEGERYAITEKGRKNGEICEGSLPYSVRCKCDRNLAVLNARLRRQAQVCARIFPREQEDGFTVQMTFSDEHGPLLDLSCFAPTQEQGERLSRGFQANPEKFYHTVLSALLEHGSETEATHE